MCLFLILPTLSGVVVRFGIIICTITFLALGGLSHLVGIQRAFVAFLFGVVFARVVIIIVTI